MTSSEISLTPDNPDFWRGRYQTNETAWDLGHGAPAFQAILKAHDPFEITPGKSLVVGCGKGHDAALFAEHNHEVTAIDFAPEAIEAAMAHYGSAPFSDRLQFTVANLFELPDAMQQHFDIVLEHTCFCAISPKDRSNYVEAVKNSLKPGGLLLALFMVHGEWGGPPYSTNPEELKALFGPSFEVLYLEQTPHSIERRENIEWLGLFKRG